MLLPGACLRRAGRAASSTRAYWATAVSLTMKSVGKPDAGNRHVRFDERGEETERCRTAQVTAPLSRGESPCILRFAARFSEITGRVHRISVKFPTDFNSF